MPGGIEKFGREVVLKKRDNGRFAVKKLRVARPGRGRGRLQRIAAWESLATKACYSGVALARISGVSLRHLQRHIRARYAMTLGDWLNALRLRHSYQRLSEGLTTKEAAFSLGFKQVSHFSRSFKRQYGFSPSNVPITIGSAGGAPGPGSQAEQLQLCLFQAATQPRKK